MGWCRLALLVLVDLLVEVVARRAGPARVGRSDQDLRNAHLRRRAGLTAFVRARHGLAARGQHLELIRATAMVRRVFQVAGLEMLLED